MNKGTINTVFALLFFLFFSGSTISVFSQSVSPFTGQPVDESALTAPFTLEVLFGTSGPSPNNVLTINGIDVPIAHTGWFCSDGSHDTGNLNYGCGQDFMGNYYRNFFMVDLSDPTVDYGITLPITSAVLRVERYVSEPPTGFKGYMLHSVTTPWATLNQDYPVGSTIGSSIFNDFGEGDIFANILIDRSLTGVLEIPLNAAAINTLNASVGSMFVLAGKADDLTPVPIPLWSIILVFGLIAVTLVLRFKKRIFA